jgi:hypothetical protein
MDAELSVIATEAIARPAVSAGMVIFGDMTCFLIVAHVAPKMGY